MSLPSQPEECNHCQRVRQHHAINNVGVKLVVASTQRESSCQMDCPIKLKAGVRHFGWMTAIRLKKTPSCAIAR